ncbi:hypothetical protein BEN49_12345 [Hymenobacter coccineus]|uniref:TonB-dependent receptor-like beta-barrel domain-containing protein n=1 Tax=Hymenobacter coccineus TaxID=1908235 RepID=A0A1G1SXY5_9BACT|nr:hypothetical protein BEN49_12345 [Hymenobacter coccineus]
MSVVVLPAVGYTLEARLLASVTASVTFQRPAANVSVFSNTLTYTQNRQLVLSTNGTVWTAGNRSLWLSDHRILHYPQLTYGLGSSTRTPDAVAMDYNLLRIHQSYYHRVGPTGALYAGVGYFLDARWNITSVGPEGQPVAEIAGYRRGVAGRSTSSGLVASVLRDTRANQLRPAPASRTSSWWRGPTCKPWPRTPPTAGCSLTPGATCRPAGRATCWHCGCTAILWPRRRPTSTCPPPAGTRTA